jgi:hypothetical protein
MNTFKEEYKTTFDGRPTNLCDNCDKYMEDDSYYFISMITENNIPDWYQKYYTCSKECSVMFMLKYM